MSTGVIGILVVSILYFVIKERGKAVFSLAAFGWGLYLIAVVKFLPQTYFLLTAIILSFIALIENLRSKQLNLVQLVSGIILLVCSIILVMLPKDERYYLLNVRFNTHIEQDYNAWDKYCWFLNLSGKKSLAHEANAKAVEIVEASDDESMQQLINRHKELLEEDTWTSYR
jgi:hypothetical protein